MSRHYGIKAETGEIKSVSTPRDVLKDAVKRAGRSIVWMARRLVGAKWR